MRSTQSISIAFIAGSMLAACADDASSASPPVPATFNEGIGPLAKEKCDGCHERMQDGPMSLYRNARSRVTPGKPDESPYYTIPMGRGHPAAWGESAAVVRAWIEAGAPK